MKSHLLTAGVLILSAAVVGCQPAAQEPHRVKYVAHRGEEALAPEGSAAAYRLAVEHGLDIMKLDVCMTKDGVPVMSHDPTLKRTMGWDVAISNVTYAEIREKGTFKPVGPYLDEKIVTLKEALAIAKGMPEMWIDFKMFSPELGEKVVAEIDAAGIAHSRVMVATFSKPALEHFRDRHGDIRRVGHVWFGEREGGRLGTNVAKGTFSSVEEAVPKILAYRDELKLFGVNMPVAKRRVTAETVAHLQKNGLWVSMWFVNDPKTADYYKGADAFVTACLRDTREARGKYEDCWFYCSHAFDTDKDIAFYSNVVNRAAASGFNGILFAHGLEGYAWWGKRSREQFAKVKRICDDAKVEIIPLVWSTGYGTMVGSDMELVESQPMTGVRYRAKGGEAVFEAEPVKLANAGFEEYDLAKNRFPGWYADHPGLESFVDTTVSHGGKASIRFEPAPEKDKYGHARLSQSVAVKPGHRYRFTSWVRAEDLEPRGGAFRAQVYVKGRNDAAAAKEINMLLKEEGWRKVVVDFNAGESTQAILYVGTWGGKSGKFWVDDYSIEEIGLREVCQRKGTPFVVKSAKTGRVYAEGKDYVKPPFRMPKGGDIAFRIPAGSAIQEGEELTVDAYIPARNGPKSQISTCMSDPRLYEKLEKSAAGIMEACAPRKWFLSVDEVRNGNTCPLCVARHTDMAHIFGECVTKMHAIIRKVRPDAVVYAWSDQFDPNHNARDNYCGCKGTFAGVWDLIPKDIVMSCWWRAKCDLTVPFFTRHGLRVQAAGYYDYDGPEADKDRPWVETLNRTPGATGFLYTTWQSKYDVLPAFGKLVGREGRPYREGAHK